MLQAWDEIELTESTPTAMTPALTPRMVSPFSATVIVANHIAGMMRRGETDRMTDDDQGYQLSKDERIGERIIAHCPISLWS